MPRRNTISDSGKNMVNSQLSGGLNIKIGPEKGPYHFPNKSYFIFFQNILEFKSMPVCRRIRRIKTATAGNKV